MPIETVYEQMLRTLKTILKGRGLTYRDLARGLKMSESGVKKLLTGKDLSLKRLLSILDLLEISLADFQKLMEERAIREIELTPEQENYLLSHFDCFGFYWKLVIERTPLDELKREFRLSARDVTRYLKALDKIGMLEWRGEERFKAPSHTLFRWVSRGALIQHLNSRWSQRVLDEALTRGHEDGLHSLNACFLSEASYSELKGAISKLLNEFSRRSELERLATPRSQLRKVGLLVAVAPMSFVMEIRPRPA